MRVVVTGATGNVGTSVLETLAAGAAADVGGPFNIAARPVHDGAELGRGLPVAPPLLPRPSPAGREEAA